MPVLCGILFLPKGIKAIEGVQKFALRVCTKSWRSNYNELLDYCDIPTMASRRKMAKLCLLFFDKVSTQPNMNWRTLLTQTLIETPCSS